MKPDNELIDVLKDIRDIIDRSSIGTTTTTAPGILEDGIMRLLDQQSATTEELARIADALDRIANIVAYAAEKDHVGNARL